MPRDYFVISPLQPGEEGLEIRLPERKMKERIIELTSEREIHALYLFYGGSAPYAKAIWGITVRADVIGCAFFIQELDESLHLHLAQLEA